MNNFEQINIQHQYLPRFTENDLETEFDLQRFNKKFEDLNLVEQINAISDTVTFDADFKTCQNCPNAYNNDDVFSKLVDPDLAKGKNYFNPYEDDYIDPNQDSPNRFALLALINKYNKTIMVIGLKNQHYYIPGGKCKIFESFQNAAVRQFRQLTNVQLDGQKLTRLLYAKLKLPPTIGDRVTQEISTEFFSPSAAKQQEEEEKKNKQKEIEVCTFMGYVFDEITYKYMKNPSCKWIPIKQLQHYPDKVFGRYYTYLYNAIIPHLY